MQISRVLSADVFRHAQTSRQTIGWFGVSLNISGMIYNRAYYPDGKLRSDLNKNVKRLTLNMPGNSVEFSYGPDRENWVISISDLPLRYDPEVPSYYFQEEDERIYVPAFVDVSEVDTIILRETFMEISELIQSALPEDNLRAAFLTVSLLLRFLPRRDTNDAASVLRNLIDGDEHWHFSLEELSVQTGIQHDFLRREFQTRFGISPGEYRMRRRLRKIINLFTYTDLSLKEVADQVGMCNVTHLNALLKQRYGKTPSEICRACRRPGKNDDGEFFRKILNG